MWAKSIFKITESRYVDTIPLDASADAKLGKFLGSCNGRLRWLSAFSCERGVLESEGGGGVSSRTTSYSKMGHGDGPSHSVVKSETAVFPPNPLHS